MLLDLYYKMLWMYECCAASYAFYIENPGDRLANDTYPRYFYGKYNTDVMASHTRMSMLSRPLDKMVSQTQQTEHKTADYYPPNLIVGGGITPVTPSDYKIENEIVSGLTCETVSTAIDKSAKTITYRKTLRNSGESDITINEVGLAAPYATSYNEAYQALIYREVLETPLVLAPGETGTVAITIKHTLPST